jgi:hypothetical protein
MMDKIYDVKNLTVDQEAIRFELSGDKIIVPLSRSGSLVLPKAKPDHLQIFELDVDGLGIYWPVLDEDLSIAGLLRAAHREDLVVDNVPSLYLETPARRSVSYPYGFASVRESPPETQT